MINTPEQEAIAKKRFLAISLVRLSGVIMVVVGLLFALDKIDVPQPPRHLIGLFLVVVGLVDAFVVPLALAKRWKSPN